MNLYLRILCVLISSLWKPRIEINRLLSSLSLRVLPNDLDLNRHMNNGRFFTICDLNRIDLFLRTGLLAVLKERKWMPIVASNSMSYKKPLNLFQSYTTTMIITHWDEKYFYATHTFMSNDIVVAEGFSTSVIRDQSQVVAPKDVVEAVLLMQKRQ